MKELGVSLNGGFSPKMDGENNGKPYCIKWMICIFANTQLNKDIKMKTEKQWEARFEQHDQHLWKRLKKAWKRPDISKKHQ